ncbi:hypothetical protein F7725_025645 [Dissostichus mawsoni]|uniref:Glutamate receptor n=1 Tax=Dissostichus mawsoni TaxID=36200 RepID=A0A7J5XBY2_DISMA|nr:hypothetical protein F7725_025645 [Dissostichus mawsoni]
MDHQSACGRGERMALGLARENINSLMDVSSKARVEVDILPKGVVSVIGPAASPASGSTISHICGEKEIPHVKIGPEENPKLPYLRFASVTLYPSNEDLSLAIGSMLRSFGYPTTSLVCAKADSKVSTVLAMNPCFLTPPVGLLRLEELVHRFLISRETLSVRMLDDSLDPTPLLKEIRDDKVATIIIDANASISYHILRKDFPLLRLDDVVDDKSNILGFSMLNSTHPFYLDAVQELNRSQEIGVRPLSCTSPLIWQHGTSLMNYLRMVEYDGLTGHIEFNSKGQRTNYTLKILEKHPAGHKEIGTWYSNNTLAMNSTSLDLNASDTLVNKTLIVTTILENPYVMRRSNYQDFQGNDQYEGFCVDMLREMAGILKFSFKIKLVDDGLYGAPEPNGSWTGMVGELINRKADVAVAGFTITSEREKVIDFSKPFMTLGISILYRVHLGRKPGYFSFLDPFSPAVWLFMLLAYLAVSCVLFLAARLSPYEWYNPHPCLRERRNVLENQYTLGNSLWFPVGGFMQQGSEIMPRALSTRCVSGVWCVPHHHTPTSYPPSYPPPYPRIVPPHSTPHRTPPSYPPSYPPPYPRIVPPHSTPHRTPHRTPPSYPPHRTPPSYPPLYPPSYPRILAPIVPPHLTPAFISSSLRDKKCKQKMKFLCVHSQRLKLLFVCPLRWAFTLIIISSYTANLAAFLTVQRMEVPIESPDDLADQTNIQYNSRYQTYQRMWNYMYSKQPSVFVKSTEEGIARVLNSKYAFLMESTMNEYYRSLNCNLTQIGGLLDTKGYGIGMPLGSPYKEEITLGILQLQESNRLEILKRRWWEGGQCPKEEDTGPKFPLPPAPAPQQRGGGVLRHPSRLALATPRPIRLVREMRLSNGKLYRGGPGSLGGGLEEAPNWARPQRLLEDPLGANTSTPPPPPPPRFRPWWPPPPRCAASCRAAATCASARSAAHPEPEERPASPPLLLLSHPPPHLRHNAHPHLPITTAPCRCPASPRCPPPSQQTEPTVTGARRRPIQNPPTAPPLPLPKTPMFPPTDLLMGHN